MKKSQVIPEAGPTPGVGALRHPGVRMAGKFLLDGGMALVAWTGASLLVGHRWPGWTGLALFGAGAMGVNAFLRIFTQHYRLTGFPEARTFLLAGPAAGLAVWAGALVLRVAHLPGAGTTRGGVPVVACLLAGPLWFGLRQAVMSWHRRGRRASAGAGGPRVLIVGAGRAGMRLCQALQEDTGLGGRVVGFVDDALEKQGVRVLGVPVLGPTELLATYVRERGATLVALSMAGVGGRRLREIAARVQGLGVKVQTVPGLVDLVGDRPWRPEMRDVAIEDLLRREPVSLDTAAIRRAVEGRVVLITGAGGSIGSELARRIAAYRPGRLVVLGRGEGSLYEIERELRKRWPELDLAAALCDIRDPVRLRQVFEAHGPSLVLHAAAHKHVPFLEAHPEEAVLNNVLGTRHVVEAALAAGVKVFVNVSTDKAVNPANVLGVSKRIGEQLVRRAAGRASEGARYLSVRFGNVLGSRGSVVPLFREQIRGGGPLTVTHPEMTRYFMTIPEAGQLVLQAGLLGLGGRVYALDMGEPVRILDLARDMARLSGLSAGVDIDIRILGARPGEKLHEELFSEREVRRTGIHPKVLEALQEPQDETLLEEGLRALARAAALPEGHRQRELLAWFRRLVPAYRPSPSGLGRYLAPEPARDEVGEAVLP